MRVLAFIILCLFFAFVGQTQQNLLPLNSFYKDHLFSGKGLSNQSLPSFLPAVESDVDLIKAINDSTPVYYTFTHILYQKHLFEIKSKDVFLTISPAVNLSLGKDIGDTAQRSLYQNTRGIHVEGDFFTNFSFSTSFYENQSRFMRYENDYYSSLGERYVQLDSTYIAQNAVIPGAGRTKPFKNDGFDYAFATGYFVYSPTKNIHLIAGNNPQFIGAGHRSILLSDNSFNAPYFRIDWQFASKWKFHYYRARLLNLLRRPFGSSAENYYEQKGYSANYLTFNPNEKISLSLFEGSIWNRGDSITSRASHPLYYNPVPFLSGLALNGKNEVSSLIGVNTSYSITDQHLVYGQVAVNELNTDKIGFQLGYRGYNFFGLNDFMVQLEYNNVPSGMYRNENPRLNYSHYNLPLAHVKGAGFQEFILRANYEFKHWYADLNTVVYATKSYVSDEHLSIYKLVPPTNGTIVFNRLEAGYRFNRKMNLSIFGNWTFRRDNAINSTDISAFSAGIRTALTNHYNDF